MSQRIPLGASKARPRTAASGDFRSRRGGEGKAFERHIHGFLAGTLGREIISGVYPPGTLLPNVPDMCKRFGVSRTVLREAYGLLSAKALIVARPKVGTRVRPRDEWHLFDPDVLSWHLESGPDEQFIADLFTLREMVEPAAAAIMAERHTPETVERIAQAFSSMVRFRDGSQELIEADLAFHVAILGGTGNPFLGAIGGLIRAILEYSFRYSWEGAAGIQEDRLRQHGEILEAIRAGSPELARRRMTELLLDSMKDLRASFDPQK
ncbi:MAG: FadR/GntR family transcriptional regulator [Ancalomicrobiaceae bacterium]|nr:FadR/GntR family transcriptional regulator [Ancalomicrobiaceae bacterium]